MQRSMDTVLLTFILVLTIDKWRECLIRNILKGLRTANITSIGIDLKERLYF